jgi:hypothetical protein
MTKLFTTKHFIKNWAKQIIYSKCGEGSINGEKGFVYENGRVGFLHRPGQAVSNPDTRKGLQGGLTGCLAAIYRPGSAGRS